MDAFWLDLFKHSLSAAWADMGTNGFGWTIAIGSPLVTTAKNGFYAPKGSKLSTMRHQWKTELRDAVFLAMGILLIITAWEGIWNIPQQVYRTAKSETFPARVWPAPTVPDVYEESPKLASIMPNLEAKLADPQRLNIIVSNRTSQVADGVIWELVTFREADGGFFSYATQNIGFVKPRSNSAPYAMDLDHMQKAPNDGAELQDGDTITGVLTVDCPKCKGVTYAVVISHKESGWYCEVPQGKGRLYVPNLKNINTSNRKEIISNYVAMIKGFCPVLKRIAIEPR